MDQAVVDSLLHAAIRERRLERLIRGKQWDDAIWAHYVGAIDARRRAVDALMAQMPQDEQDDEQEGFGL